LMAEFGVQKLVDYHVTERRPGGKPAT